MAVYREDIVSIDLSLEGIHRSRLNNTIGQDDEAANRFGVRVYRDGAEENLEDTTVNGYFTDAEGNRTTITGSASGNVASVTLPDDCYAVEGNFRLAIKATQDGVTSTLRIVDGTVCNTNYIATT